MIRADASVEIGGGHIVRCLALADALADAGWRCAFACSPGATAVVPTLAASGHILWKLDNDAFVGPEPLISRRPGGCDALIVDDYRLDSTFEAQYRGWAGSIVAIDELLDRQHDCDLLVDATEGRARAAYDNLVPRDCTVLIGGGFALLRPQFAAVRCSSRPRDLSRSAPRILVGFGATDRFGMIIRTLRALRNISGDFSVDVVVGSFCPDLPALDDMARTSPFDVTLHVDTDDVAHLMQRADLAIGAPGVSAWERCCVGLPTLVVSTNDNQRAFAAALEQAGAISMVGHQADLTGETLAAAIESAMSDRESLSAMSRAALALCDGLGARRIAANLDPPTARDGQPIRLRRVAIADAPQLLEWQRDPDTRRFFREPKPPERDEHVRWLAAKLADGGCIFDVILHGDEPAGVVRLDHQPDNDAYQVSILVAPDVKRMGIGLGGLTLARRLVPRATLRAHVLPGNVASERLFAAAGYVRAGELFCSTAAGNPGAMAKNVTRHRSVEIGAAE